MTRGWPSWQRSSGAIVDSKQLTFACKWWPTSVGDRYWVAYETTSTYGFWKQHDDHSWLIHRNGRTQAFEKSDWCFNPKSTSTWNGTNCTRDAWRPRREYPSVLIQSSFPNSETSRWPSTCFSNDTTRKWRKQGMVNERVHARGRNANTMTWHHWHLDKSSPKTTITTNHSRTHILIFHYSHATSYWNQ